MTKENKDMKIELTIEGSTTEQIEKYKEILGVLIEKGALDGIKGGSAIIHFDSNCLFQGVQLDYWPWRRKKN